MRKQLLGITWLHGRFHAVNLAAGPTGAGWLSPKPVNTPDEFAAALVDAVRETGFHGQKVLLVIDHRNLLFHVQEAPPAKGKVLKKILQRLVAQNQFFDEPAAHAHVELPAAKGLHRHLLALLPQSLLDSLNTACADQGLRLDALWPAAAVIAPRLGRLPAPASEVVVLATPSGDSMNLLLGRSDGKLLFSRTVALGGTSHVERATQEINRTLHYAQQQFGAQVNLLFVSGHESFEALKAAPFRAGLKIAEAPESGEGTQLLRLATALSTRAPLNFARDTGSRAVTLRTLAAAGIAAAFVASIATTVLVETKVHAREQAARAAQQKLQRESDSLDSAVSKQRESRSLRGLMTMIGSTNDPPVIELFARHLPTLIPPSMRLTELTIEESLVGWTATIRGVARKDNTDLVTRLEQFDKDLETGPFQLKITDSSYQRMFRGDAETASALGFGADPRTFEVPIFVTGVIQ